MSKIIIVHGWRASPAVDFVPWLGKALQERGFTTMVPQMPNANMPTIGEWVEHLSKQVGTPDKDTYIVGRSVGCQAIIRYLSTLKGNEAIGGALLIAPFTRIRQGALDDKGRDALRQWIDTPIDWESARRHCIEFAALVSADDPYIDPEDSKTFEEELGAKVVKVQNAGHFREVDGYKEIHIALDELLRMIEKR